jgi:hypothetical protein
MCTVLTKMEEFQQQMKAERERKSQAQKKWYIDNRERLNTKAKQYYQDNKQRLKKESQHIKQCPLCGTPVRAGSLSHHKRTQKCMDLRKIHAIYNPLM